MSLRDGDGPYVHSTLMATFNIAKLGQPTVRHTGGWGVDDEARASCSCGWGGGEGLGEACLGGHGRKRGSGESILMRSYTAGWKGKGEQVPWCSKAHQGSRSSILQCGEGVHGDSKVDFVSCCGCFDFLSCFYATEGDRERIDGPSHEPQSTLFRYWQCHVFSR